MNLDFLMPTGFLVSYLIFLGIVSLVLMFAMLIDKRRAVKHKYRIPEKTLFALGFFGAVGGLLGMRLFKHKTRKSKFYIVFIIELIVEAAIYVLLSLLLTGVL